MFKINVDVSAVSQLANKAVDQLLPAIQTGIQTLSTQTHLHIAENVNNSLHSSRQKYIDALKWQQVDNNTYLIVLEREAWWIEDGIKPGTEMIDFLLRQANPNSKPPKTAKDGSRYRVIPFQHNKGPTSQTKTQNELKETIRTEMGKRGIPYGKLEMNADGTPKLGKLHSFDIKDKPLKTQNGVGQGWGEIGKPKVGATGIPFLQGVNVYQTKVKDKSGKESVQKQIMTFRIVSSKHKGTGRWVHPGFEPKKFLQEGYEWALKEWNDKILPQILETL
jgi:hypothetical protein